MIYAYKDPGCETIRAPVLKVFDGDGILTRLWHRYRQVECDVAARFGFIDAPEMEQPGGREAQEFLSSIVSGKWLELVILHKVTSGRTTDRWGRIFCVPYLPDADGLAQHRNVELEMVLNGWAWVLDCWVPPECYSDALSDAQAHRRGIWAYDRNVAPWTFKKKASRRRSQTGLQPDLFAWGLPRITKEISCGPL